MNLLKKIAYLVTFTFVAIVVLSVIFVNKFV